MCRLDVENMSIAAQLAYMWLRWLSCGTVALTVHALSCLPTVSKCGATTSEPITTISQHIKR